MIIGVPKEIKKHENRVSLVPSGVEVLVQQGHTVLVQNNAGLASNHPNEEYTQYGAKIIDTAEEIFAQAEMIVKVKEPQPSEFPLLRKDQILFTYLHFASSEELTKAVMASGCIAIAYETIQDANGSLPLLTPMSEVAGRMSVQIGARFLQKNEGGLGVLLGGIPGVRPGKVLVIGGGVVGTHAARMAAGLGANVFLLDINLERLRYLADVMPANVTTKMSNAHNIRNLIKQAELVINGILIPGAKAPKLITRDMLKTMKKGSVIVDVAIDQGGGLETSRPTDHENPTFTEEGVIHYCVTNMPGAVPETSTAGLTNATFPYIKMIADLGLCDALQQSEPLKKGVNIVDGNCTYQAVADAFGLDYTPLTQALEGKHLCAC